MRRTILKCIKSNDSTIVDFLLGFNISSVEKNNCIKKELASANGEASWSNTTNGRAYSSDYNNLLVLLKYFSKQNVKTIVDVGSGYGRLGLLCGLFYPSIKYIGYEIVPHRVNKAKAIAAKHKFNNVTFIEQDLSDKRFILPQADAYYMYDPVNKPTLENLISQLAQYKNSILAFSRGRDETSSVVYNSPTLCQQQTKNLPSLIFKVEVNNKMINELTSKRERFQKEINEIDNQLLNFKKAA